MGVIKGNEFQNNQSSYKVHKHFGSCYFVHGPDCSRPERLSCFYTGNSFVAFLAHCLIKMEFLTTFLLGKISCANIVSLWFYLYKYPKLVARLLLHTSFEKKYIYIWNGFSRRTQAAINTNFHDSVLSIDTGRIIYRYIRTYFYNF